jgi:sulfite reductase (ferredoxin)
VIWEAGIDEVRRLVREERQKLRPDPRWTAFLSDLRATDESPLHPGGPVPGGPRPDGFEAWQKTNVRAQAQGGYFVVTVSLPLGDMSSTQARRITALARRFTGDTLRATVDQNILLRWVSGAHLLELYTELARIGLGAGGAGRSAMSRRAPAPHPQARHRPRGLGSSRAA